jgi:hypothetical protein
VSGVTNEILPKIFCFFDPKSARKSAGISQKWRFWRPHIFSPKILLYQNLLANIGYQWFSIECTNFCPFQRFTWGATFRNLTIFWHLSHRSISNHLILFQRYLSNNLSRHLCRFSLSHTQIYSQIFHTWDELPQLLEGLKIFWDKFVSRCEDRCFPLKTLWDKPINSPATETAQWSTRLANLSIWSFKLVNFNVGFDWLEFSRLLKSLRFCWRKFNKFKVKIWWTF